MNDAPIGIFDSGVGGLTVLAELTRRFPRESFIYLGDTARVPYGTKSARTVERYTLQAASFLLRQQVKGMVAAMDVVKPGGTIILAAECSDGFPDHGSFREVLASEATPAALLEAISARTETVPDQWQVQVLARVLARARVGMYTTSLSDSELRTAHLFLVPDVGDAVRAELARLGPDARVCVLPEGPQTIPYVTTGALA